jgi:hypothetical protein
MNETSPDLPKPAQGADAPAQDRRRLLRAAATAAPLIATLPSGAALAVASTYQCVDKDKVASTSAADFVASTSLDQWVRVAARRQEWSKIDNPSTTRWAISFDDVNWYRQNTGKYLNTANWTPIGSPEDVAVLRIYSQAALQIGDVSNSCAPLSPLPANAPYSGCVFPIAQRDVSDNMGSTGSCMASFA